jgi:hypothetical protein
VQPIFWASGTEIGLSLLYTDISSIASMEALKEKGQSDVIQQISRTVNACIVESKVTRLLSTGMGQVLLEAVTLGADSTK